MGLHHSNTNTAINLDIVSDDGNGVKEEKEKKKRVMFQEPPQHSNKTSSATLDPRLLTPKFYSKGESALRDNSHFIGLNRQASIGRGSRLQFERKMYLDFNLYDDSSVNQSHVKTGSNDENVFDFDKLASNRTRSLSKVIKPRQRGDRKNTLHGAFALSKNQSLASQKSCDSDDDDIDTPRSPKIQLDENAGIGGGGDDGTFLGSAHLSINIENVDELWHYHEKIQEKVITIGRSHRSRHSRRNSHLNKKLIDDDDDKKKSKLKFKVYCNALAAYLK